MASPKILPTDPIKRKAWASEVYQDSFKKQYYARVMGNEGTDAIIVRKRNLEEKGKGDEVTTTLIAKLIGTPIFSGEKDFMGIVQSDIPADRGEGIGHDRKQSK